MDFVESKFYIIDEGQQVHYKDFILRTLMKSFTTAGDLYADDLYFIFPFTNQALALLAGIENAFFSRNFLSTAILTRSLIDCVMSLVYITQVSTDDYQAFLDEFRRSGELTKRTSEKKKCKRLTGKDLTDVFLKNTGINLMNSYKQLSKMVHSTIFHMHANTKLVSDTDNAFELAIVGERLEYPQRLYDELRDIIEVCINTIEWVLKSSYTQYE
ncbi:MAG: hypothetical protein LBU77_06305 [Clostridiales bacterium]|jgi:hypothetical protein|nr:hypothetical protein [Clostridiales bacterium]